MVGTYWYKNSWRASINTHYLTTTALGFELHHPLFDATILKQGAQLIHFQPKEGEPLFWCADLSTFEKGKAFRGGIPLCWPWFGKAGIPSHGFARIVEWTLLSHVANEEGIKLVFELSDSMTTRAIWPYAFNAHLTMVLGKEVALSLHVKADKESTAALHSYFTCKQIDDVNVTGLGLTYIDALLGGKPCEEVKTPLHVNRAIDRIYTRPDAKTILQEKERTITITHENHSDVVVWNPWLEGSEKLSDMNENDYTKMLCIESARITKPLKCDDRLHVTIHVECRS
ncbi:D-hexose-6-phosphate mutarotase [Sulfurospirillum diekertiae]|uniref:Putative glucose-6-phosphate 1-epimerase n=1 Tax=Sulfurospirillum diekertiae TaxID=1854492 RepID=A0A1Y0HKI1_9BACT|nr:D-hexose-6-phosphate mutarotase [Sulfurospirillum diekertiae]ARU48621.1 Putative glucose-6-phosphate 1-epimerase [Sulfurospirillum diekertiae]ASC93451.1 Putative glucose-6-phosphate 1-epimerase [Sulfurospirillum diekertiae]